MKYNEVLKNYKIHKSTLVRYVKAGKIRRERINSSKKEYDYNEEDLDMCFNNRFKRYNICFYNDNNSKDGIREFIKKNKTKIDKCFNINKIENIFNYSIMIAKNKIKSVYITNDCDVNDSSYNYLKEYSSIFNININTIDINNDSNNDKEKVLIKDKKEKENKVVYNNSEEDNFNKMLNFTLEYGNDSNNEEDDEIEFIPRDN